MHQALDVGNRTLMMYNGTIILDKEGDTATTESQLKSSESLTDKSLAHIS